VIGIVDYNMGNLASVINAFAKVGVDASLESDPAKLSQYDKLILPGVGAFADAMKHLKSNGMDEAVKKFAQSEKDLDLFPEKSLPSMKVNSIIHLKYRTWGGTKCSK
jgi:glutamine amidotransferase